MSSLGETVSIIILVLNMNIDVLIVTCHAWRLSEVTEYTWVYNYIRNTIRMSKTSDIHSFISCHKIIIIKRL